MCDIKCAASVLLLMVDVSNLVGHRCRSCFDLIIGLSRLCLACVDGVDEGFGVGFVDVVVDLCVDDGGADVVLDFGVVDVGVDDDHVNFSTWPIRNFCGLYTSSEAFM